MLAMSKQNVSQKLKRIYCQQIIEETVVDHAEQIRKQHPRMGCRKMYFKSLMPLPLGRDKCERILLSRGFKVRHPINYKRTTYSIGKHYYPNLIEGLELTNLNQVWQTDITYFEVGNRFYYLVFIQDIYSRRIIGWSVNKSLWAEANIEALRQAIGYRKKSLNGLIHHSDRGSQYIDKGYTSILKANKITPSMCKHGWQNAYCERVNGIIKNEYLKHWRITSLQELTRAVDKAVYLYNHERPHWELPQRMPPVKFEQKLKNPLSVTPILKLYKQQINNN
jgi:transposase InsO family protein